MKVIFFLLYIAIWIFFAVILYTDIKSKSRFRQRKTAYLVFYRENEDGEFIVKSFEDIKDIPIKHLNDCYDYILIEIQYFDGSNYSCYQTREK